MIARFSVPTLVSASPGDIAKVFLPQGSPQLATGERVGACVVTSRLEPVSTRRHSGTTRAATPQPMFTAGKIVRGRVIETCRVEKSAERHDSTADGVDTIDGVNTIIVMEVLGERVLAPGESWN